MNTQRLGKRQRDALKFIESVNGWRTFAKDVRRVVLSLKERGLVLVSGDQFAFNTPIHCDQCEMLSINGVNCHETECPNSRKKWVEERGEWVRFVNCFVCGFEVEQGESCCQEVE